MPGRVIMEQQGAIGSQDLKKDRSHAQQGAPPVQPAGEVTSTAHVNGPTNGANGALPNGVPSSGEAHTTSNGTSNAVAGPTLMENPPALDQSWREMHTNKSLGLLMQRLASQCAFDLQEALSKMNEVPTEPQHQQPNGVMPHTGQDTSDSSMIKKRMLLDFASIQRERFIKTMILTGWSKGVDEMSTLLDVKVWQDKPMIAHKHSLQAILNTKNNMLNGAMMPNPNIEGAMEILATGKASWIPDMGFIPPKRLNCEAVTQNAAGYECGSCYAAESTRRASATFHRLLNC